MFSETDNIRDELIHAGKLRSEIHSFLSVENNVNFTLTAYGVDEESGVSESRYIETEFKRNGKTAYLYGCIRSFRKNGCDCDLKIRFSRIPVSILGNIIPHSEYSDNRTVIPCECEITGTDPNSRRSRMTVYMQ